MKVNNKAPAPMMNDRSIADLKDAGIKRTKHDAVQGKMETGDATKVNLSAQARHIAKATEIAKDQNVNEEKIDRLQKLIDAGKYKVDNEAVAENLLNEHLAIRE